MHAKKLSSRISSALQAGRSASNLARNSKGYDCILHIDPSGGLRERGRREGPSGEAKEPKEIRAFRAGAEQNDGAVGNRKGGKGGKEKRRERGEENAKREYLLPTRASYRWHWYRLLGIGSLRERSVLLIVLGCSLLRSPFSPCPSLDSFQCLT